jgi:hypothetical protein
MRKQFKNVSSVDFSFCRAGCTATLEVGNDGLLQTSEQRARLKEGHLIEVKVDAKVIEKKGTKDVVN